MNDEDTIAAPITAPGHAGVSVVRVSGGKSREALKTLSPEAERALGRPREAVLLPLYDILLSDKQDEILDWGLVTFFSAPKSYTGEDCLEVSLHGSPYLVSRLLKNLQSMDIRLARPGEFTERAFHNGKIDLSQAEAVADLIASETELQARVAREQLEGRLSSAITKLGEPLRDLLAEVEATIDFPEEDIQPLSYEKWGHAIGEFLHQVEEYVASYAEGRICRDGALVVLAGLPNAGKSSLLNQLLGEERAIVTAIPGTTRDSIEEVASVSGIRIRFCDTAGLVQGEADRNVDEVELLGMERSRKKVRHADLLLYVLDATQGFAGEEALFHELSASVPDRLLVANKSDLFSPEVQKKLQGELQARTGEEAIFVSALLAENIDALRKAIAEKLLGSSRRGQGVLVSSERHYEAFLQAATALNSAKEATARAAPPEFVAADMRSALAALESIIGITSTEDILGRIFSKFCIGK